MFDNIPNANISVASEEDLLAAAGDAKPEAGKDKTEKGKDKKTDDKKTDDKNKSDKSKGNPGPKKAVTDLSAKDLDAAAGSDEDENDDDNDDEPKDDKTDDLKKKKSVKKEVEDKTEDEDEDEDVKDEKEEEEDDDKNEEDDNKEDQNGPIEVKDFLKARVELLIKKGEWVDFEGRDEIEWDEDTFADVELQQRSYQKEQIREELLDSFGPYGREIADYSSKGGDPEKLIDIYKEQQRVVNLSVETEDDQKAVVLKYVTEFQNMKPKQAQTYINALIADKELADTAKEAKESMEADLKLQEKNLKDAQDEAIKNSKATTKANLEKFSKDVSALVNSRDDIPADEKRDLLKVLTKFDKTLKNGTPVNDFYFKFAEFRKDLPNYIELVRFVMNPKKYAKTEFNKGKSETAEKAFSLVKSNNKAKKMKTSAGPADDDKGKKKTTFKLLY